MLGWKSFGFSCVGESLMEIMVQDELSNSPMQQNLNDETEKNFGEDFFFRAWAILLLFNVNYMKVKTRFSFTISLEKREKP